MNIIIKDLSNLLECDSKGRAEQYKIAYKRLVRIVKASENRKDVLVATAFAIHMLLAENSRIF